MSKCALCGQRNVDGAIDQFGEFVCVDYFATGEANFRKSYRKRWHSHSGGFNSRQRYFPWHHY